ncbi:hypothetical protein [Mucilaginibacter sp.]
MKRWKKLLLYCICIAGCFSTGIAVIMACSDEPDPYDYYTSFFHSDIQGKKDFGAFYFTDYQFTYTDDEPASEAAINAAEWADYLGQPVQSQDVKQVMYDLDSIRKKSLVNAIEQDLPLTGNLATNNFLQSLKQPAHQAALQYYKFALEVEPLANTTYDEWNPAPKDTAAIAGAAQKALEAAGTTDDSFIKLRYYYQAQRLFHYGQDYEKASKIYDQYISPVSSKSHAKGWALSCRAGEERRTGDSTVAAYQFSKVFANYPERRVLAYRNYHYIGAPLNEVLKHARTPEEKANLYAIQGFANPEIESDHLEQVYDNAPSSPMVGVLLVREINKLEQYYLTPALNNNNDQFYSSQSKAGLASQPGASSKKWLLWMGIVVLLAGITGLVVALKSQPNKPSFKIAGGIAMLIGITSIIWFVVSRPKGASVTRHLPQGSFFVTTPDSIKTKYNAHIEKLRSFCTKLTSEAKYTEPQIGTLADAYLYFMQNRADDGLSALNKLDGQPLNSRLADEKQIIKLLLSAQRIKQVQAVDESSLLPALQWLHGKVASGTKPKPNEYPPVLDNYNRFASTERNFYTYVLAPAYLRQGDTAKAALAMLKSNNGSTSNSNLNLGRQMPDFWFNYLHSPHLEQMINWKTHPQSARYMTFLTDGLKAVSSDNIYELLGTVKLREHNYAGAAAAFQHIKNKKVINTSYNGEDYYNGDGTSFLGDPFNAEINDYPKTFAGKQYTKLSFAQKMAALQSKVKADPKNADAFYQLANGLYNTSTYGNSWGLITYQWSSYDFGRKPLYYYDTDYIKATQAKQYYLKARELSDNPEFKAQCTFMAAKCEQKEHVAPSYDVYANYDNYKKQENSYLKSLKQNSHFKEMQQYKSTAFYKEAVNQCSYLSDFINGK